jgi:uncharacterized membrane protein YkoI
MSIAKRLYLVAGLVALLAIAFSAVTLTSHLTSAQGSNPTPAAQTSAQPDEADDAAEAVTEEVDTDDVQEESGPQDEADDTQEPQLNGSVAVPEGQNGGLSESDEAAALASLATITPQQAGAAAQAQVPGDVQEESGPQDEADDTQEPQLNGSIAVSEGQNGGLSEADEAAALASLATITPEQAGAAAQAQVPGDVQHIELDNENGSLVYSVEIGGKDVKVDAGNGAVLHVESDGPED